MTAMTPIWLTDSQLTAAVRPCRPLRGRRCAASGHAAIESQQKNDDRRQRQTHRRSAEKRRPVVAHELDHRAQPRVLVDLIAVSALPRSNGRAGRLDAGGPLLTDHGFHHRMRHRVIELRQRIGPRCRSTCRRCDVAGHLAQCGHFLAAGRRRAGAMGVVQQQFHRSRRLRDIRGRDGLADAARVRSGHGA
jgi:hypothetical protein